MQAEYRTAFAQFIHRFNKVYIAEEEVVRFNIFKANYDRIRAHNSEGHFYELGVTIFADLSHDEFVQLYAAGGLMAATQALTNSSQLLGVHEYTGASLPSSVDWRKSGAVTNVKNQGQCGACWAFASAGALEGAWQIATGILVSLSEQQLMDCSSNSQFHNTGCQGGAIQYAYEYAKTTGTCNYDSYPYEAKLGTQCKVDGCRVVVPKYGVTGYKQVKQGDEKALLEAVSKQPVTVAIEADQVGFQLYSGGVLTKPCGTKVDHGVLIVGYGTDQGLDYWLVKNSWGLDWGESGYIRIQRGKGGLGECAINLSPVFPVVDGSRAKPMDYSASLTAGAACIGVACLLCIVVCFVRRRRGRSNARAPLLATQAVNPSASQVLRPSAPPTNQAWEVAGKETTSTGQSLGGGGSGASRLLNMSS